MVNIALARDHSHLMIHMLSMTNFSLAAGPVPHTDTALILDMVLVLDTGLSQMERHSQDMHILHHPLSQIFLDIRDRMPLLVVILEGFRYLPHQVLLIVVPRCP